MSYYYLILLELRQRYHDSPEVIAFQCRNPLHRAHAEMFRNDEDVQIVVHPSIGPSKQDDFDARIRGLEFSNQII